MTDNRFRWLVLRALRLLFIALFGPHTTRFGLKEIMDDLQQGEQALERDGL